MAPKQSAAFIEQALIKVFSRGERTIQAIADELNMNVYTLKNWMRNNAVIKRNNAPIKEQRPQDWSAAERLSALQKTHGLSGEELNAWCRENGLFAHHLTSWKTAFCAVEKSSADNKISVRDQREIIIESVFAIHGLGFLAWDAVSKNDFPVVQAVVMLLALIFIGLTLLADIANGLLDPRLRSPS